MAKDINRVTISGNLTREPELRQTASGTSILCGGVAVNDSRRNAQGNWEEFPNFVDWTLFGNRAASLSQYLHKGTTVFIDGKLRYEQWEKDGQKRSKIAVIVDDIKFISNGNNQSQGQATAQYAAPVAYAQPVANAQPVNAQPVNAQPVNAQPAAYVQPVNVQPANNGQPPVAMNDMPLYDDDIPF